MIYCIQGPTASGKTSLAITLAMQLNTEIISADSRQFYREMAIGTAKPNPDELATVQHHFINNRSVANPMNVADFQAEGMKVLHDLLARKSNAVVVGGSGQFIDSLVEGLDHVPVFPEIRSVLEERLRNEGLSSLKHELSEKDPFGASQLDLNNPRRVLRALEVLLGAGVPLWKFHRTNSGQHASVKRFAIAWKREDLYDRINQRVDLMIQQGLEAEVRHLLPFIDSPPLNTVGYKEWLPYFEGKHDFSSVVDKIKQHSRNYAKRQITWMNRYENVIWLNPYDPMRLDDQVKQQLI